MATRKPAAPAAPPETKSQLEIGTLYEQELQALNEDLRRQAALSMFYKLQPTNKITVEQFISGIKQHKDVWSVVAQMGIVDFADAINDGRRLRDQRTRGEMKLDGKRTRLNDNQKQALKQLVLRVLSDAPKEGYNRAEIANHIPNDVVNQIGVQRVELANKLRQPLGELVAEKSIHSVGEKRLMKYMAGPGAAAAAAPAAKGKKGG